MWYAVSPLSLSLFVDVLSLIDVPYSWHLVVARYGFWDAEQDDDAAFDRRVGAMLREVGDRGKLMLSEAVPPSFLEPTPAPAPAPKHAPVRAPMAAAAAPKRTLSAAPARPSVPAPASAPAPAPVATPVAVSTPRASVALTQPVHDPGFSPSMQAVTPAATMNSNGLTVAPLGSTVGTPGAGVDSSVIAFMREERDFMAAQMKEQKEEVERLRREQKEEMKEQKEEAERQRKEMAEQMERQKKDMEAKLSPAVAISSEQLVGVQARLEKMHATKLLTDDELFAVEVRANRR